MPDDFSTLSYRDLGELVKQREYERDKLMRIICDVANGTVSVENLRLAVSLSMCPGVKPAVMDSKE